jgi:uncharacterized membrane protein YgcG
MALNFVWAYGYNAVAIPLAAGALYPATHALLPPWVAALAMAASSASVACAALLLRLYRPPADVAALRAMAGGGGKGEGEGEGGGGGEGEGGGGRPGEALVGA